MRYVVFKPVPGFGFAVPFSSREAAETFARECGEKMEAALDLTASEANEWAEAYYTPDVMVTEHLIEAEDAVGQGLDGGERSAFIKALPVAEDDTFYGGDSDPYIAYISGVPDGHEVPFRRMTPDEEAKFVVRL